MLQQLSKLFRILFSLSRFLRLLWNARSDAQALCKRGMINLYPRDLMAIDKHRLNSSSSSSSSIRLLMAVMTIAKTHQPGRQQTPPSEYLGSSHWRESHDTTGRHALCLWLLRVSDPCSEQVTGGIVHCSHRSSVQNARTW